jgi:outer membrane murein-binding lipoprotein Lpp
MALDALVFPGYFRKAISINSRGLPMKSYTILNASIVATCVIAFSGCTDLKPIQAQIDDLKSQVSKLQSDTAKSESDAQAALSAAQSASSAALSAQSTANQALSTAQQNATAIDAINEKIDRMFKKSVSK